ncbi:hypothetical protein [Streptomyces cavernae]|uniref:hypothetical protein n=1 Tax=Streptomyces cavernae TaxID=2259034 RepID=UPI0012D97C2C|nr:hypothetical protein [Streptomyces cavernae]
MGMKSRAAASVAVGLRVMGVMPANAHHDHVHDISATRKPSDTTGNDTGVLGNTF